MRVASCFIWAKMRVATGETAPQIAVRNCSKEAGGKGQYICEFWWRENTCNQAHIFQFSASLMNTSLITRNSVTMKDFSTFLDMKRCKNWAHKISSWEYLTVWRPVLPIFPEHRVPHFCSPPWTPLGVLKISSRSTWFNPSKGRWQAPMASANL